MGRKSKRVAVAILWITLLAPTIPAVAQDMTSQVTALLLQVKNNRLYFDVGREALIFPGASFRLTLGDSARLSGSIAHSWEGISISERILHLPDSAALVGYLAQIEPAVIDSQSSIRISSMLPWRFLQPGPVSIESVAPATVERLTDSQQQYLEYELGAGDLDAIITTSRPAASPAGTVTEEATVSAGVVLLPNVSRSFNQYGTVTTSLYYRFDPGKARLFYASDHVGELNSLMRTGDKTPRPFEYDPARGRDLLQTLHPVPLELRLYVASPELRSLGLYFADILSRDPCRLTLVDNRTGADLYLELLPLDPGNPSRSLFEAYRLLIRDSVAAQRSSEQLEIIKNLFDDLTQATDESVYFQLLDQVEHILTYELGVLPLFRPVVFLTTNENIVGLKFDGSGFLDVSTARKLILPSRAKGGEQ